MCRWFGAEVELCAIGAGVKTETILMDYLTEGEHVNCEEEGSKHRALRHTLFDRGWGGVEVANGDERFSV